MTCFEPPTINCIISLVHTDVTYATHIVHSDMCTLEEGAARLVKAGVQRVRVFVPTECADISMVRAEVQCARAAVQRARVGPQGLPLDPAQIQMQLVEPGWF